MITELDTIMAEIKTSAAELEEFNRNQERNKLAAEQYQIKLQRHKFAAKLMRKELGKPGHVKVEFIEGNSDPIFSGSPASTRRVKRYSWGGRYTGSRTEHIKSTEKITVGKQYKTVAHLFYE